MYFLPSMCGIHKPKKYFFKEKFARRFLIFLFYMFGDDRLKISSDLKTNSWCINFLILSRSWNYGRVWVTIGLGFSISSIPFYSRVHPNSITFPIDFVFILMYFSILSQKFFTPHPPKVFYPTLKSFLPPPRRPLPFDLSTLLSLDKSHTSSGSMNKNGGRRWGKKLFTGVKN